MRQVALFLRWVAPLVLALAVIFGVLRGCQRLVDASTARQDALAGGGLIVRLAVGSVPPAGAVAIYGLPDTYTIPKTDNKSIEAAVEEWSKRADVVYVHPNFRVQLEEPGKSETDGVIAATVNDPYAAQQWALDRMNVYQAWNASKGDGVIVAVVDTGVTYSHVDLAGKMLPGKDFVNGDNDPTDDQGHGTHVSGIIGATTNNHIGVAGVGYNARVLPVKVLDSTGGGYHDRIASGIVWAADQGARVINLSLGGGQGSPTLEAATHYAWDKGVVIVCAAGNNNTATPAYPAAYPNCIAVGATDQSDVRAGFSNFGEWVDLAAPGAAVLSTVRSGVYQAWDGTSMAAPNVAGVAALVAAAHPTWDNAQIRAALENGADALPGQALGRGRVNAARAVGANPSPGPSPTRGGEVPTPTATPVTGDYARQVEGLINQARAGQGLPAFRYDYRLTRAAEFHNRWMRDNGCFSHNCPGEPDVAQRIRNAQYPLVSAGENIGKGYTTPQAMMDGWMNSAGHRAAILNTYWPDFGCGYLLGPSGHPSDSYWSCEFARGSGEPMPAPTWTPLPWPGPPTPRPLPTPTSANGLPRGWFMTVEVPFDTATWGEIDRLYREWCVGRAWAGVRCGWKQYRLLGEP